MWISLFAVTFALAICFSVSAIMSQGTDTKPISGR